MYSIGRWKMDYFQIKVAASRETKYTMVSILSTVKK